MKQLLLASLMGSAIALATSAMAEGTDLQALEQAARAEGAVNSVGMPDSWANWKDTWADLARLYGLKHQDTDMSSAQEIAKFAAEKENATADIGDVGAAFGPIAVQQGVTQPYKPSTWAQIPDWAKDEDGHWMLAYTGSIAFIVNKQLVKDIPRSWADLKTGTTRSQPGTSAPLRKRSTVYWRLPSPWAATRATCNRPWISTANWPSSVACRWPTRPSRPWRRAKWKSASSGTSTA